MSFRKVLFFGVAVFFGLAVSARAQVGVYGMYAGNDLTGITCLASSSVPARQCSSTNGAVKPFGGVAGIYYDFRNIGPVRLGVDFRGQFFHANKSAASSTGDSGATRSHTALGGVRATFHTPVSYLRPYAQISAGWTNSNATELNPELYDNYLQYEGFAGVDVKVFPILDVRPVELGIGEMNRIGNGAGGASAIAVKSIGAGLVFHLP